jgi:predicted nuclease of predicted toxin-antitoxin system
VTIKLYFDNDVNLLVIPDLRAEGYDVQTSPEAGNERASDEEQWGYATAQGRVLLTFNRRHFRRLQREWQAAGKPHAGILVSRQYDTADLLDYLRNFLRRETPDSMEDRLANLADYK